MYCRELFDGDLGLRGDRVVLFLVSQAKRDNRFPHGTYIDTKFMPTMARLYKENRTFVPPETADFSHLEAGVYDRDG